MDPVQDLLAGVGQSDVNDGAAPPPHAITGPSPSPPAPPRAASPPSLDGAHQRRAPVAAAPAAPRRTKMVFVYSDEDDDAETAQSSGVSAGGRVAAVACDAEAIAVSADALEELRAQAAEMHVTALRHRTSNGNGHHAGGDGTSGDERSGGGEDGGFVFEEDVVSGLAALGRAGLPFSTAGGMRVREVEAPRLWDGALASANGSGGNSDGAAAEADETPQLLHRGLPAATFVLESRRKRFREAHVDPAAGEAEAVRAGAPAPAAAALLPPNAHDGSRLESASEGGEVEVEEEVELDVHPVYEADGTTVRALRTRGGYELTLDERDLLDGVDEEGGEEEGEGDAAEEGAAAGADGDGAEVPSGVAATAADLPAAAEAAEEAEDWGEFGDGDDEDDEEEEELDEALVVAVVEQLVRCCEADDLDPQMTLEASRFVATAKPLLAQLTEEVITPAEFGQRMDRDLRRFQRIYKSVYRPRDTPIVVDGVITDL